MDENGTHAVRLLCCLDTKAQTKKQQGHRAQPRKEAGPHGTHTPGTKERRAEAGLRRTRSEGGGKARVTSGKAVWSLSLVLGTVNKEAWGHQWAPDLASPMVSSLKEN